MILGFGSAGYAALMAIKRRDPGAAVSVIDQKQHDLMHPCGLPYSLNGHVDESKLYQDVFLEKMGVEKIRARVLGIDGAARAVRVERGGREDSVPFDRAIIATGARPVIPPIKGVESALGAGLHTLSTVEDLALIRESLHNAIRGVIIGAGAIGLETAIALRKYLQYVSVFEMRPQVLPGVIDADMSKLVEDYLRAGKIDLRLATRIDEVIAGGEFTGVRSGDEVFDGEMGILSVGFIAETAVARESGIDCDANGIIVNESLETSMPGVYAAGDCISCWSVIDKKSVPVKLATSAYRQGVVAGENAAGSEAIYHGTAGTFVTKVCEIEVAGTGYTTETAKAHGYEPVSGKIKTGILPDYFHGGSEITIKIICDKSTGRLLGAQAIGERGAAERINILSMALEFDLPIDELGRLEMAYCPAVSEVIDPLFKAVEFVRRRIGR